MYSIDFPEMFSGARTNLIKDDDAVLTNLKLLLSSWKFSLFGDPYYGSNLKKFIFEQNNVILRDLVVDEIFMCIQQFMPQVYIERKDIEVTSEKDQLFANISITNRYDKTTNLYKISLMSEQ